MLRYNVAAVSISVPWGLNVGLVGLLPYLPLPTKLQTRVLPPVMPANGDTPEALAARVSREMQAAMNELTADRVPLLGPARRNSVRGPRHDSR
jgi:hypothetical protein